MLAVLPLIGTRLGLHPSLCCRSDMVEVFDRCRQLRISGMAVDLGTYLRTGAKASSGDSRDLLGSGNVVSPTRNLRLPATHRRHLARTENPKERVRRIVALILVTGSCVVIPYYISYLATHSGPSAESFPGWITSVSNDTRTTRSFGQLLVKNASSYLKLFGGGKLSLLRDFLSPLVIATLVLCVVCASAAIAAGSRNSNASQSNPVTPDRRMRRVLWSSAAIYFVFLSWFEPGNAFYKLFIWPAIALLIGSYLDQHGRMWIRSFLWFGIGPGRLELRGVHLSAFESRCGSGADVSEANRQRVAQIGNCVLQGPEPGRLVSGVFRTGKTMGASSGSRIGFLKVRRNRPCASRARRCRTCRLRRTRLTVGPGQQPAQYPAGVREK